MNLKNKQSLPKWIGVIHLPPLIGSPGSNKMLPADCMKVAIEWAIKESIILEKHGFDGIILENFGDAPFYKTKVPSETIASMAIIASEVRKNIKSQLGINILRNDPFSALSIAASTSAEFIRVNVLSGVYATDQGIIEGEAATLIREKSRLNANHIKVFADVHVKHAQSLSSKNIEIAIEETAGRGGADAIIISGETTGRTPHPSIIETAVSAGNHFKVPIYLGSGAKPELLKDYPKALGIIVGSTLRKGGVPGAPLDGKRIKKFIDSRVK